MFPRIFSEKACAHRYDPYESDNGIKICSVSTEIANPLFHFQFSRKRTSNRCVKS